MKTMCRRSFSILMFAVLIVNANSVSAVIPGVTLVGRGAVAGNSLDRSGLTGDICQASDTSNCVSAAILGGYGSDITYTGHDNVYVAAPDRGPFDGLTDISYINRFHFFHITTSIGSPFPNIRPTLLDTRFFKNEFGQFFLGGAGEFDITSPLLTRRLDPEGIRIGANGNFYISDEYGPYVFEFDRQGNLVRRLNVPAKFAIANPNSNPSSELTGNTAGRQANRGMEGLAITPDGTKLIGIMQNALLQDNALMPMTTTRISVYSRIVTIDLATGESREFVYPLVAANRGQGISEILAINDHEFLVVERDNRSYLTTGEAPTRKDIFKIDINGATDVSNITGLPATGSLPVGVVPVTKSSFINLLDPVFGLQLNNGNAISEKVEGLAWGPDLPNGNHLLYVTTDNDLMPTLPTQIFAFEIASDLISYQRQSLPGPFFPPGQVKKALNNQ